MTRPFIKLYSDFWINPDNTEVMQLGLDVQLMALYLQGNSHHNILGVYYLPMLYAASDLKQPIKKVQTALKKLCDISYCKYDTNTQYIWVCNMALEQIGEEIAIKDNKDNKDNRIKAIQAIWSSLPIKIEFLPELYNKYHNIFNLKSRFTNSLYNRTKNNSLAKNLVDGSETYRNINVSANTNNIDSKKEPTIDDHLTSISPTIDLSLNLTSPFEGVYVNKKPLQSPPLVDSNNNFSKTDVEVALIKKEENIITTETCPDTSTNTQAMVSNEVDDNQDVTSEVIAFPFENPSKDFTGPFATLSEDISNSFEAPSKALRSSSEAPLEPLRSNIEYRSKNIEDINKNKEIEREKKKDINLSNVLIPKIVVQARPYVEAIKAPANIFNSSFLKQLKDLEETEKTEAVDAKKQLIAYQTCNLPVVTTASMLETNLASVFSVSSDVSAIPVLCNDSVVPFIHTGSMDSDSDISIASADAIKVIFEHWKIVMNHPRAKLDCKRKNFIRGALKMDYTIEELCDAATGCSITPHNIGENQQGQRYDGLHIIFKDADNIDRFIYNRYHPPKPKSDNKAIRRQEDNINELNKWLESKNKSIEAGNNFVQE